VFRLFDWVFIAGNKYFVKHCFVCSAFGCRRGEYVLYNRMPNLGSRNVAPYPGGIIYPRIKIPYNHDSKAVLITHALIVGSVSFPDVDTGTERKTGPWHNRVSVASPRVVRLSGTNGNKLLQP